MPSTISLLSVVQTVQTAKGMKPLIGVGGIANQPALDICNDTLQQLLSAPYAWRFNKNAIGVFTTIPYQQDYIVSGCNAVSVGKWAVSLNALGSSGGSGLGQVGATVTANYSDFAPNGFPAGITQPRVGDTITVSGANQFQYNITTQITAVNTPNPLSFQYLAAGGLGPDGGQGINNINWMEHVTLADFQSTATVIPVHDAEIAAALPMESIIQPPIKFSYHKDNFFGVIPTQIDAPTFRAWPVPSSQIWGVYLFYQARAPLLTDLNGQWTPWPDDLGYVLRAYVKAAALDWWEDPRAANSYIIAQQMILKALGSKDQELRHESMFPDLPILRGG
jgi:hypothetical protein